MVNKRTATIMDIHKIIWPGYTPQMLTPLRSSWHSVTWHILEVFMHSCTALRYIYILIIIYYIISRVESSMNYLRHIFLWASNLTYLTFYVWIVTPCELPRTALKYSLRRPGPHLWWYRWLYGTCHSQDQQEISVSVVSVCWMEWSVLHQWRANSTSLSSREYRDSWDVKYLYYSISVLQSVVDSVLINIFW